MRMILIKKKQSVISMAKQNIFPVPYFLLLLTFFITIPSLAKSADTQLQADAQSLLHSLDNIAVDYPATVDKGVVQATITGWPETNIYHFWDVLDYWC